MFRWSRSHESLATGQCQCHIIELRWLVWIFQGQYLTNWRIHCFAINKKITIALSEKVENLLWAFFVDIKVVIATAFIILLRAVFLGALSFFSTITHRGLFFQYLLQCSWSLNKICKSVSEIFWDKVFVVKNTVITRQWFNNGTSMHAC